jgi:hypothetical protein
LLKITYTMYIFWQWIPYSNLTSATSVTQWTCSLISKYTAYSAEYGFWLVEELAQVGVVKWWGVGVRLELVWQGQLHLHRWTEGLNQTWHCHCHCISDSLLNYCFKIPAAKNYAVRYISSQCSLNVEIRCLKNTVIGHGAI